MTRSEVSKSQVAVSLHYLANNLSPYLNERGSVLKLFGECEDGYLDELYPFAEAVEEARGTECPDGNIPGVWHYEVADDLAPKLFIEMIQCNTIDIDPRPDLTQWRAHIKKAVRLWVNGNINFHQPILPQLSTRFPQLIEVTTAQKHAAVEKLLAPLHSAGVKNIQIVDTRAQNLTEIFIGDHLYATVDFDIIGHGAITTVNFRGMPDGRT